MLPEKMTAAVLYGREDIRMEDIKVPRPGPGEMLLKIKAALTCGTDVKVFLRGYHARMITPPAVFGHEFAGEVAALGPNVTGFNEGDRIVAANSAPCGKCFYCRRGRLSLCDDLLFVNGAYAEYLLLPKRIVEVNSLHVPPGVSLEHAAMTEPLACALKGVEELDVTSDDTVAVIGAGPLGLMHVRLCAERGARVISIDMRDDRLDLARELGAEFIVNTGRDSEWVKTVRSLANDGRGADKAIEAVGKAETWESAIAVLRKGGIVNLFGGCSSGTSISVGTGRMHYDEIRLIASFHHTPTAFRRALNLIDSGTIPADKWIKAAYPLSKLKAVFREMLQGHAPPKTAIIP